MTKISQLTDLGAGLAAGDEFIVRDVSEVSTPNKKVTASGFIDYVIAQGVGAGFTQIAAGVGPLARVLASSSGATGALAFSTAAATTLIERARIDSSGRLLVGTTTSVVGSIGSSTNWPAIAQFNSTSIASISLGLFHWSNYAVDLGGAGGGLGNGPDIVLARSNTNTQGVHVAVTNNILLGRINFSGSDGTQFINGACIAAAVDGTPGANDMPGRLVFSTTADGAASPTERMRIDSTGLMTLAGPGIKFPATQVASTDPNTLDDYEEGTFTPTVIGTSTAGTATYAVQNARYTKTGRAVFIEILINWSAGSGTGNLRVSGLPFTSGSALTTPSLALSFCSDITMTASHVLTARIADNSTQIEFLSYPSGGGAYAVVAYDAAGVVGISGCYSV